MLDKLIIQGFQSHKETVLEFSEGLNAIIGRSDSGKTAILRSLEWLCFNRPRGEGFQSWWPDVDKTIVKGAFGDKTITRIRTKSLNQYQINKDEPLKALRSDVPDEINDVLQLSEINLQKQHSPYFLLQDTPSAIASKFNELAGMEVMDECVSQAKTLSRSLKQQSDVLFSQINDCEIALREMDWLDDADKAITVLTNTEKRLVESNQKIDNVNRLLVQYDEYDAHLSYIDKVIELLPSIETAIETFSDISNKEKTVKVVDEICCSVSHCMSRIKECDAYINMSEAINEAINRNDEIRSKETKIKTTNSILSTHKITTDTLSAINIELEKMQIEFDELMIAHKVCPLCDALIERK